MRWLSLLLVSLPFASAFARAPVCTDGELRVSAFDGAWFDLYVDGRQQLSSRVNDGQQAVRVAPGRHRVKVTDFMGRVWSDRTVDVGCGEVFVGEVREDRGLQGLSRYVEPLHRSNVCPAASLTVSGRDDVWFDLYVDGVRRVESRSFDGRSVVGGLEPGEHHVRVTSFMGDVWSETSVVVGCGSDLRLVVSEGRGLR